jgi:hypothetical protein
MKNIIEVTEESLVSPKSLKSWLEAAASANPTAAITK